MPRRAHGSFIASRAAAGVVVGQESVRRGRDAGRPWISGGSWALLVSVEAGPRGSVEVGSEAVDAISHSVVPVLSIGWAAVDGQVVRTAGQGRRPARRSVAVVPRAAQAGVPARGRELGEVGGEGVVLERSAASARGSRTRGRGRRTGGRRGNSSAGARPEASITAARRPRSRATASDSLLRPRRRGRWAARSADLDRPRLAPGRGRRRSAGSRRGPGPVRSPGAGLRVGR